MDLHQAVKRSYQICFRSLTSSIFAFLFLIGVPVFASAQSETDILDQFEEAKDLYYQSDFQEAGEIFASVSEEACANSDLKEICFESEEFRLNVYRNHGETDRAEEILISMADFVETEYEGNRNKLVRIYSYHIFLSEDRSAFSDADKWVEKLRELVDGDLLENEARARAYIAIGFYEDGAGNYQEAVEAYEKTTEYLAQEDQDRRIVQELLNQTHTNKGVAYRRLGMPEEAMGQYQKALEYTRALFGENHLETATIYNNIGTIHYVLGDIGLAADYFVRTARIIESELGPNHQRLGASLNNAGLSYYGLGDYEKAAEYLERAQRVKEENLGTEHIETAIGYSNLAGIHIENEDFEAAEANFLKSISVRQNIYQSDHPNLIDPNLSLGRLYLDLERPLDARHRFDIALEIALNRHDISHPSVAKSYLYMADSYSAEENYQQALGHLYKSANSLYGEFSLDEELDKNKPVTDPVKLIELLHSISTAYRNINETENNVENLERSYRALEWVTSLIDYLQNSYQSEVSKLNLIDRNYSIYTDAVEVLNELYEATGDEKHKAEIFAYTEMSRSRIALELLQDLSARSFAGVPENIISQERELNEKISAMQQNLFNEQQGEEEVDSGTVSALQDSLFYLERELHDFTEYIEEKFPTYYALKYDQSLVSLSDAQNLVGERQTLVTYIVGDEKLYALVVNSNELHFVPLGPTGNLADDVTTLRNSVVGANTEQFRKYSHSIYKKIVDPILEFVTTDELIIMADQMLHYLPFEMLLTEEVQHGRYHEMPYLVRDFTVSYAPSVTMLRYMDQQRPDSPKNLFALAPFSEGVSTGGDREGSSYFNNLSPLPLTAYETRRISEIFSERRTWRDLLFPQNIQVLLDGEATKSRLRNQDLTSFNYLHFSTHAFINEENPAFSGIALYQEEDEAEVAYVDDIYTMELNADLVVLGACETGLGSVYRGEGLIGFTQAFIYAGASNLMVSMWRVNDQPTANLMINFYEEIRSGKGYNESLRNAKLTLIENPNTAAPRNWAAFVLQGR